MNPHRQHYFAPGAIDRAPIYSRAHQRRALRRWLRRAAMVMLAGVVLLMVLQVLA